MSRAVHTSANKEDLVNVCLVDLRVTGKFLDRLENAMDSMDVAAERVHLARSQAVWRRRRAQGLEDTSFLNS
jgi:hypothetical protein